MNIWNTDVLAFQLANDEIDQYQKTKYYIGSFYLQVIGTVLPMFILGLSYTINVFTLASFIVTVAVFHTGAINVFKGCAAFKKASALDTLVVLGLPVCIKIQIVYWATYVHTTFFKFVSSFDKKRLVRTRMGEHYEQVNFLKGIYA